MKITILEYYDEFSVPTFEGVYKATPNKAVKYYLENAGFTKEEIKEYSKEIKGKKEIDIIDICRAYQTDLIEI
jgi:hypothetical protein